MSSTESNEEVADPSNQEPVHRRPAPHRREPPQPRREYPDPSPLPRYSWMRGRIQGFHGEINLYIRDDVIHSIPRVLHLVGGNQLLDRFRQGPFGYLLHIRRSGSANNALHELLARELEDASIPEFERWYHVGRRDIRLSMHEYALVTGLNFGEFSFNPHVRQIIPQRSLFYTKYGGKSTKINQLKADFNEEAKDKVLGTPDQYLKASNLLMF